MNKFYALDVETANADYSSICQIGIAEFNNGELTNKWESLINPQDYFDLINISIHQITPEMVSNSPTFKESYNKILKKISGEIVVHHMPFDRIALNRACEKENLNYFNVNWIDSAKVVRRTWNDFAYSGYGLQNITTFLNINFKHHDALEDAIAAGKVFLRAIEESGLTTLDWLERIEKAINPTKREYHALKFDGNPEGPLFGESIVFTGTLCIPRTEAAQIAAELGCNVLNNVTKKTTLLVVGKQEDFRLAGYSKSSKHRKAEQLISKGQEIRILSEDDFKSLTNE